MIERIVIVILLGLCIGLGLRLRRVSRRYRRQLTIAQAQLEKARVDRTREEAQMLHHAKMRAIGELAGGVAHEVNNPLMIISGYSEMIIKIIGKPDPALDRVREISHRIIQTSRRIAFVIQALRNYSHNRFLDELEILSITGLINQALALCKSKIQNAGVDLQVVLEEGYVKSDGGKFLQVLLALIMNAVDAVSQQERKEITIQTRRVDDRMLLTVQDNGVGVPAELREKIFQPFFTTKSESGTGLGLSVAKSIVETIGGSLRLDEAQTELTTFIVEMPAQEKPEV